LTTSTGEGANGAPNLFEVDAEIIAKIVGKKISAACWRVGGSADITTVTIFQLLFFANNRLRKF